MVGCDGVRWGAGWCAEISRLITSLREAQGEQELSRRTSGQAAEVSPWGLPACTYPSTCTPLHQSAAHCMNTTAGLYTTCTLLHRTAAHCTYASAAIYSTPQHTTAPTQAPLYYTPLRAWPPQATAARIQRIEAENASQRAELEGRPSVQECESLREQLRIMQVGAGLACTALQRWGAGLH